MVVFSFISDTSANTGLVSITIKRICAVVGSTAFVLFVYIHEYPLSCYYHRGNSYIDNSTSRTIVILIYIVC